MRIRAIQQPATLVPYPGPPAAPASRPPSAARYATQIGRLGRFDPRSIVSVVLQSLVLITIAMVPILALLPAALGAAGA